MVRDINVKDIKNRVDYGIICIRQDETQAVKNRLSDLLTITGGRHSYSYCTLPTDTNRLTSVVLCRPTKQGQGEAQTVTANLLNDINPQYILLVGISGGFPGDEYSLGDVILSTKFYDYCVSASIEGKEVEFDVSGGIIHQTVKKVLALPNLDSYLGEWNAYDQINCPKPSIIIPKLSNDKLYGIDEWKKKVIGCLKNLKETDGRVRDARIITGSTITSDTLIKDTKIASNWKMYSRDAVNVEMELGGVYRAVNNHFFPPPLMAVRGLSDIIGYRRGHDWLIYACNTAAAVAIKIVKSDVLHLFHRDYSNRGKDKSHYTPAIPSSDASLSYSQNFVPADCISISLGDKIQIRDERYLDHREKFEQNDDFLSVRAISYFDQNSDKHAHVVLAPGLKFSDRKLTQILMEGSEEPLRAFSIKSSKTQFIVKKNYYIQASFCSVVCLYDRTQPGFNKFSLLFRKKTKDTQQGETISLINAGIPFFSDNPKSIDTSYYRNLIKNRIRKETGIIGSINMLGYSDIGWCPMPGSIDISSFVIIDSTPEDVPSHPNIIIVPFSDLNRWQKDNFKALNTLIQPKALGQILFNKEALKNIIKSTLSTVSTDILELWGD
jgi:nucleoside phosphorylase